MHKIVSMVFSENNIHYKQLWLSAKKMHLDCYFRHIFLLKDFSTVQQTVGSSHFFFFMVIVIPYIIQNVFLLSFPHKYIADNNRLFATLSHTHTCTRVTSYIPISNPIDIK